MQNAIFNLLKLKNISPDISMSKRRRYLDAFLWSTRFEGAVLDIGGRKGVTRGKFRPPQDQVTRWDYVNIVPEANPDYLASAEMLPIADASYDCALMSEVLEHLEEPEKALKEAARVLKSGGAIVLLSPFLYPQHKDPADYQRWLPDKYTYVLSRLGFADIIIMPMGGILSVLYDIIYTCIMNNSKIPRLQRRLCIPFLLFFDRLSCFLEKPGKTKHQNYTTGYYVIARKA